MGVSVIVLSVSFFKYVLLIIGIVFLAYMGWVTWQTQEDNKDREDSRQEVMTAKRQVLFACSVSLLNPHAILDTIGVIGASSVQYHGSDKIWFALAGILVSFIWFTSLVIAGGFLKKLKSGVTSMINKVSAGIIWASAVYLVINFL
jgi:L-lysine exporter family protein LysE/ArgO